MVIRFGLGHYKCVQAMPSCTVNVAVLYPYQPDEWLYSGLRRSKTAVRTRLAFCDLVHLALRHQKLSKITPVKA